MNQKFLNITRTPAGKIRIEIDGTIGGWDWDEWKEKNTGKSIREELKKVPVSTSEIEVLITSLGGYVSDAMEIHDALKEHPAKVTTIVQGFCASAATIIACAGDERIISPNAFFLIHKCMNDAWDANENTLEELLESQRTINEGILSIYRGVLKKDEKELEELFNANEGRGKWIDAQTAVDFGFATKIQEFESGTTQAKAMASLLDHARRIGIIPQENMIITNTNTPKNQENMKKIYAQFALLAVALSLAEDTMFDESKGLQLTNDQLQTLENKLDELKTANEQLQNTKNDLQKAQTDLAKAQSDLAKAQSDLTKAQEEATGKDTQISNLTAERDTLKAQIEKTPGESDDTSAKDDGKSLEATLTEDPMYAELLKNI